MLDSKGSNSGENNNYNQPPQSGGYGNGSQQQGGYNNSQPQQSYQQQQPQAHKPTGNEIPDIDIDEDEIPF